MKIAANNGIASAPGLVRTQATANWAVADNDMNAGYVWKSGWTTFRPLVQATWLAGKKFRADLGEMVPIGGTGIAYISKKASRCYMGSVVELMWDDEDAGAIINFKLGVKEVEDAYKAAGNKTTTGGLAFADSDWGMYVVRLDAQGRLLWHGRYPIHKGNAQVVQDPTNPKQVWLIASTGIRWTLDAVNGRILKKDKVSMGASGEKNYATSYATSFVGYTGHPCLVSRIANGNPPGVPVCSKPTYAIGPDEIRCSHKRPSSASTTLWWVMILDGKILFNKVNGDGTAKWDHDDLPSAGGAVMEIRHTPALFECPGKATVGIVIKSDGLIQAQPLTKKGADSRILIGGGAWPAVVDMPNHTTLVYYMNGGQMRRAVLTHE